MNGVCQFVDERKVLSFTLVDATTDQDIGTLGDGDTIDLANLKLNFNKVEGPGTTWASSSIYGDDVDDAAAWANTTSLPTTITKTTASASVSALPSAAGLKTIAVTTIVQEIVDRVGWASGNDMRFAIQGGVSERRAWIDDLTSTLNQEAVLEIDFTAGAGGGGSPTGDGYIIITS